ncbi:replication initiator protein A [Apilactobacillus xinyiensis]|uniref:replication initiator protein A n=1 Tax=Apilactobacillus xinyiensis TaxID=2841032 RepID=UPI0033652894
MNQFVQLNVNILKNKDLNSDEKITLSLILDRMKSSMQRRSFYDSQKQAYYVVYPVKELMDILNVGKNTVVKILKKLEYLSLIVKKRSFNRATRIFIAPALMETEIVDTSASLDNKPAESQKVNFNQKINQNLHSNTVNTGNDVQTTPVVDRLQQWAKATKQKVGLTFTSIQAIQKFCKNNVEKCKQVVRLILNARNSVAKANRLVKQPVAQFESNQNIINGLAQQLDHIFSYAVKLPQSNYAGYVTNALKAYFTAAFGLETKPVAVKPTVKATKFNDGKKHIHEELPEWAQDDYEYVPNKKIDLSRKAKLKLMLEEI